MTPWQPGRPRRWCQFGAIPEVGGAKAPASCHSQGAVRLSAPHGTGLGPCPSLIHSFSLPKSLHGLLQGDPDRAAFAPHRARLAGALGSAQAGVGWRPSPVRRGACNFWREHSQPSVAVAGVCLSSLSGVVVRFGLSGRVQVAWALPEGWGQVRAGLEAWARRTFVPQQAPCVTPGGAIRPEVCTVSVSPWGGAWSVSATGVCVCVCQASFWEREKQKVVLLWRLLSGGPLFSAPISYETLIPDSRGLALPGYLPPTLLLSPDPKCLPSSPPVLGEGDGIKRESLLRKECCPRLPQASHPSSFSVTFPGVNLSL